MQTKLQELTDKIYQEGIDKANEEAEKIRKKAKDESEKMLADAQKESEEILQSAKKEAEELKKNSLNELQLTARQIIADTQQRITKLIESKTIEPEVKGAFDSHAFTMEVINTLVKNWNPEGSDPVALNVLLPDSQKAEFEDFFKNKAHDVLKNHVELTFSDRIKGGFKIGPKEGGYLISFTDEDFDNFFRSYLRPKLSEMLYGDKDNQK